MMLLNFAHPITQTQLADIKRLIAYAEPIHILHLPIQADRTQSLSKIAAQTIDQISLSATEWQTTPLVINPPGLAPLALTVLAHIHGRCGYFPAMIDIRPQQGVLCQFEIAEIINLQHTRHQARQKRQPKYEIYRSDRAF